MKPPEPRCDYLIFVSLVKIKEINRNWQIWREKEKLRGAIHMADVKKYHEIIAPYAIGPKICKLDVSRVDFLLKQVLIVLFFFNACLD